MKKIIAPLALVIVTVLLSFVHQKESYSIKASPVSSALTWINKKHSSIIQSTKDFAEFVQQKESELGDIQIKFHQLKNEFKSIEFIYYYLDPQSFSKEINGAPLPKILQKVPEMTVLSPKGFQRIEEMIYTHESKEEILMMILELKDKLVIYSPMFSQKYITDPVIFEALRYGLIRMNTMGITGFDAPGNADESLNDASTYFESYLTILNFYKKYIPNGQFSISKQLSISAVSQLKQADFESFDRFTFIREILDPLWRNSLQIQNSLQIELPNQRFSKLQRPVNYSAKSLYAADFLNKSFFSEYTLENDEVRISLGEELFFDSRLSKSGESSCASCHHPNKSFTDGLPLSTNFKDGGAGKRNSPTLINSVYAERYFHDMRVDRLAFQMDHVVLNPIEFNTRYDSIVSRLQNDLEFNKRMINTYGKEGITKNTITNAMSSYVASLTSFDSPFDKMVRNETEELDTAVIAGFNIFMGKGACATCHFSPTFSGLLPPEYAESESEVLGVPSTPEAPFKIDPDLGRFMNHLLKEQALYNKHAFKTPTVRNIIQTSPYMHNGVYNSLDEVIEFYDVGGGIGLGIEVPNQTLPSDSLHLTDYEKESLKLFLQSLESNPFAN